MISVLDRRVPARGRTPDRLPPWVSARTVGDPLLVGLVALVVYALHGRQGYLDRDLGVFVYGGEHVARGPPPYTEIFNIRRSARRRRPRDGHPARAAGRPGPIPASRLLFLLLSVVCVVLVHALARDVFRVRGGNAALLRARAANDPLMQRLPPGKYRFAADPPPRKSAAA